MPVVLRQILAVTFRWAGSWSILGLFTGILLMFGKGRRLGWLAVNAG